MPSSTRPTGGRAWAQNTASRYVCADPGLNSTRYTPHARLFALPSVSICLSAISYVCQQFIRDLPGQSPVVLGHIDLGRSFSPREVINFFYSHTDPRQYNPLLETQFRLRTYRQDGSCGVCAYYQSYRGGFGIPGRDFCLSGSQHQVGWAGRLMSRAAR